MHHDRPLMVQFVSYNFKNITMESLYKLQNAEQKFKAVVVAHDMTFKEKKECRSLGLIFENLMTHL